MPTPARLAAAAVVAVALIAYAFAQPSLTPPAGPIQESGRDGVRIEINDTTAPPSGSARHVITQPGSYYLSGDIDAGTLNGIEIATGNVTIDLNGYTLRGTGRAGITPPEADQTDDLYEGLIVRNGHIEGFLWGVLTFDENIIVQRGFITAQQAIAGTLLEDLVVEDSEFGIEVRNGVVRSCAVRGRRSGIVAIFCTVTDCQVTMLPSPLAFKTGINVSSSTVVNCTVDTTNAQEDLGLRGFALFSSNCSTSTTRGIGQGFIMGVGSVANGCASYHAAGNDINPSAIVNNSNF